MKIWLVPPPDNFFYDEAEALNEVSTNPSLIMLPKVTQVQKAWSLMTWEVDVGTTEWKLPLEKNYGAEFLISILEAEVAKIMRNE